MRLVEAELVSRAMAAATALAAGLGLQVDDVVIVHNSNKLALRLLPCDVFARVAVRGPAVAALEVELARRLAATASPVAALEPRVEPRIYERDGFTVTFWTYYQSVAPDPDSPAAYADALHRLHIGLRRVDIETPHFLDRVAEAERLVAQRHETPTLAEPDRYLLLSTLKDAGERIQSRGAAEQLCMASHTRATFCAPTAVCCSSTSRRAAADPSSSTSRTCQTRSPRTIRISMTFCFKSVAGSFLRWSPPGAGTSAMSSRTGANTAETS